jgi:hypothetical protein
MNFRYSAWTSDIIQRFQLTDVPLLTKEKVHLFVTIRVFHFPTSERLHFRNFFFRFIVFLPRSKHFPKEPGLNWQPPTKMKTKSYVRAVKADARVSLMHGSVLKTHIKTTPLKGKHCIVKLSEPHARKEPCSLIFPVAKKNTPIFNAWCYLECNTQMCMLVCFWTMGLNDMTKTIMI